MGELEVEIQELNFTSDHLVQNKIIQKEKVIYFSDRKQLATRNSFYKKDLKIFTRYREKIPKRQIK